MKTGNIYFGRPKWGAPNPRLQPAPAGRAGGDPPSQEQLPFKIRRATCSGGQNPSHEHAGPGFILGLRKAMDFASMTFRVK